MTTTTAHRPLTPDALADWQQWHADRETTVLGAHGIAALTGTTWLGDEPVPVAGLDGQWVARDGRAQPVDRSVSLAPGEELVLGELLLRALQRGGVVALRVYDPAAPTRTDLTGIATFQPGAAWTADGLFTSASSGASIGIDHVDGSHSDDALAGTVTFELEGRQFGLSAFPAPDGGLQITFADATNGEATQQFRFLTLPAPDADGRVTVDLNRAYLPPCAFTDHYLCPIPPVENRLPVAVRAGETFPI